jgi:hypothetical protein
LLNSTQVIEFVVNDIGMVLDKVCDFWADWKSKMTSTEGHSIQDDLHWRT